MDPLRERKTVFTTLATELPVLGNPIFVERSCNILIRVASDGPRRATALAYQKCPGPLPVGENICNLIK